MKLACMRRKPKAVISIVEGNELRLEHNVSHDLNTIASIGLKSSKAICVISAYVSR